jgi:hypothetical protein
LCGHISDDPIGDDSHDTVGDDSVGDESIILAVLANDMFAMSAMTE